MKSYYKGLQKKIARIFELSSHYYNPFYFLTKWKESAIAQSLLDYNYLLLAQSKYYILKDLQNESLGKYDQKNYDNYAEIMYWLGFILTKYCLEKNISWKILFEKYDIERFLQSYETLHTLSSKIACEELECNFNNVKNIKKSIFN